MPIRPLRTRERSPISRLSLAAIWTFLLLTGFQSLWGGGLGYALSGGGARGYAHVGILKVLEENGVYPRYITGTSVGAVIGGLYGLGYSAVEIERLLLDMDVPALLNDGFTRKDLYIGQKRWAPYGNLVLELDDNWTPRLPSGIYAGNPLNLHFARMFLGAGDVSDFATLPVSFACVATDLVTGEPVVFREGSLMQAVRASISVPSVVEPLDFGGRSYIDGGVSQNLPVDLTRELGADTVIGFKVNSALRPKSGLVDLVDVIDQTINIGIIRNLNANLEDCDLLLEPELADYSSAQFDDVAAIIAAGEAYAWAHLDRILAFRDSLLAQGFEFTPPSRAPQPQNYYLTNIQSHGNVHISGVKIREYLGLETNRRYTPQEIFAACEAAWNSQSFHVFYPVLKPVPGGHELHLYVQERKRGNLSLNATYTTEEELNVGLVLALNNMALKNSRFQAAFTLGGRTELSFDYVKNFGELWGSYFRLFPYLSEYRLYLYDADGYKTSSVRSLEYGITPGVGVFAKNIAIAEAFLYSYRTRLYRDVSATAPIDSLYLISGFGVKGYHESLDDFSFPRSGARVFAKLNVAPWESLSDRIYSRFAGNLDLYARLAGFASLRLGLNGGSYFGYESENVADPFYFGGANGYRGYQRYAKSAPRYGYGTLGTVLSLRPNVFFEAGIQGLTIGQDEYLDNLENVEWSLYAELGIRTPVAPIRFTAAVRESSHANFYLNLGFDHDIFWFSRK